jgi:TldD protein
VDEVVARTLVLFDAKRPPAGEMPVMLAAGASSVLLHEAIGHGMEADFNRIGTSIYSDMIGKPVAAPFVNVVDQGNLPHELGTLNMDDEGNATGRAALVEKGILKSYLHDTISARHYGFDPGGWICGKGGQSVPVSIGMPSALVSRMTVGGENV